MKIQSLSVVVPPKPQGRARCVNHCAFCVSGQHDHKYPPNEIGHSSRSSISRDYKNRLQFARDNGCNTLLFTGAIEPLQNVNFINSIMDMNAEDWGFRSVELQTTGYGVFEHLHGLKEMGITGIALSVNNLFDDRENMQITGSDKSGLPVISLTDLCNAIKKNGFNLRLSLNMLKWMAMYSPESIIERAKMLGADQVLFRHIVLSDDLARKIPDYAMFAPVDHSEDPKRKEYGWKVENCLTKYPELEPLAVGLRRFAINGVSVVYDTDCMRHAGLYDDPELYRYLILQTNGKLYSRWDEPASLVF